MTRLVETCDLVMPELPGLRVYLNEEVATKNARRGALFFGEPLTP